MIHDSRRLVQNLIDFISANVTPHGTAFDVSGVKGDGTVAVRFRSSIVESSNELAYRFGAALNARKLQFVQTDDCKFRLALAQF